MADQWGKIDANHNSSLTGVAGTLGTADTGGTADIIRAGINPLTGALYVEDTAGNVVNAGTGSLGTAQQRSILTAGGFRELSGSATTGTTDIIASFDVSNYRWLSIQLMNTWVGTVLVQLSNDNVSFTTVPLFNSSNTSNVAVSTLNGNNLYEGELSAHYLRIQTGAWTSGTVQTLVDLFTNPSVSRTLGVSAGQNGAWNVGGTLQNLNYGTVDIDPKPTPVKTTRTTYGTTGTTGAAVFGTLVASVGAGTFAYITGYQIVVASGTVDCAILDGTFAQTVPAGGTNMITRGQFPAGGGIARDLTVPYVSGTAGTICYWMGGAGTAYFQVDYWAST